MGREYQDGATPEERVRRAHAQKKEARERRPEVDRIVARLTRHLEENHFAERFIQQLNSSRRHA